MAVLFTSGRDPDWPDSFDPETGRFTYFGDNKRPGSTLHETPRGGNELLRFAFAAAHGSSIERSRVPPFFIFRRSRTGADIEFLGLAVPGGRHVPPIEDLVAVWRTTAWVPQLMCRRTARKARFCRQNVGFGRMGACI